MRDWFRERVSGRPGRILRNRELRGGQSRGNRAVAPDLPYPSECEEYDIVKASHQTNKQASCTEKDK